MWLVGTWLTMQCPRPQAALLRTGIPSVQVAAADGDAEGELEVDGDDTTLLDGSRAPLMVTVHRVGDWDDQHACAGCTRHQACHRVADRAQRCNQPQCGAASVVDVRESEAGCLQDAGALHVAVSPQGAVCGVTKVGGRGLDPAVLLVR